MNTQNTEIDVHEERREEVLARYEKIPKDIRTEISEIVSDLMDVIEEIDPNFYSQSDEIMKAGDMIKNLNLEE